MTSITTDGPRGATEARAGTGSRAWAWLGLIGFVLGYVATWSVQFLYSNEDIDAGGAQLLDAIDSGNNEAIWRLSSGIGFIAVACLIAFAVGLKRHLDAKSGGKSAIPGIIQGSFFVTLAVLAVAMSFRAQVFDGWEAYAADPTSHVTINRLSQDTVLTAWATLGAGAAAVAFAGIRGYLFPKWLAWFSAVMTALIVLLCLGGVAFPANIPAGLWLLAMCIWAIRQEPIETS